MQRDTSNTIGDDAMREAEREVAMFLDRYNLNSLHEAQLRERLSRSAGDDRIAIARELGRLYLARLESGPDPHERREIERLSSELLEQVPGVPTLGLRLDLIKTRYLAAELVAEKARLRLAEAPDVTDAIEVLTQIQRDLHRLGAELDRMVNSLEAREERVATTDAAALRTELTEARRYRSLAKYYAGWSGCYLAMLAENGPPGGLVQTALEDFGSLLNAPPGRAPTWSGVPKGLLRYDHIARAAMGAALCYSLGGDHATASRWLEELEANPELTVEVRRQLRSRQIIVDADGDRWFDINGRLSVDPVPLDVNEARLLAILAGKSGSSPALDAARRALTRLIELGEIGHVLDIAQLHGSLPIEGDDFIVLYVRGLRAYHEARELHDADVMESGQDAAAPADRPTLRTAYREAATLLLGAAGSADASRYDAERGRAELIAATCLYFANELIEAAEAFGELIRNRPDADDELREHAFWYHALALQLAQERGLAVDAERTQAAAQMYLLAFPDTERSARLILQRSGASLDPSMEAVETLIGVERDSSLYASARRQAVVLLYRLYRANRGAARERIGTDLISIAPEVLQMEIVTALDGDSEAAARAADRGVLLGRQLLAVALSVSPPALDTARAALDRVDQLRSHRSAQELGSEAPEVQHELNFRRLQIELFSDDFARADAWLEYLREVGGVYAHAGEMAFYRRALAETSGGRQGTDQTAQSVAGDSWRTRLVDHGTRLIGDSGPPEVALQDQSVAAIYEQVSAACAALWRDTGREEFSALSLRLSSLVIEHGRPAEATLIRTAELSEQTDDRVTAIDAWLRLMAASEAGAPRWFRARYQSLRLLAEGGVPTDIDTVRDVLDQIAVLYPGFGPEPWATRLRQLRQRIGTPPPTQTDEAVEPDTESSAEGGGP